jgi:hypothetical protein
VISKRLAAFLPVNFSLKVIKFLPSPSGRQIYGYAKAASDPEGCVRKCTLVFALLVCQARGPDRSVSFRKSFRQLGRVLQTLRGKKHPRSAPLARRTGGHARPARRASSEARSVRADLAREARRRQNHGRSAPRRRSRRSAASRREFPEWRCGSADASLERRRDRLPAGSGR